MTYHRNAHRNHRGLMIRAEKLFGTWAHAVKASGLMYRPVPPPVWPGELILRKIRKLRDRSHGANFGTRLYYSARSAFGSWRYAVELAGFPYFETEPRFRWRPEEVTYYIRWLKVRGEDFDRLNYPELCRHALRCFGSRENAIRAAKSEPDPIPFKYRVKRPREAKSNPEIARDLGVSSR